MSSEKYIGLDVHQATVSVAVMDSSGKVVMESILETKAATILEFFAGLRGTLSVTFEEGTWAAWLYDLLKPHVAKLVVCNPRKNALLKHGNKSDRIDAFNLADLLRLNRLESVYHGETSVRMLRELARSYHRERSFPGYESSESSVSQLGDSLCRPGRLLHSPSQSVAGQNPGSGNSPPSRAALSAIGLAAAAAPASAKRTLGGEPEACHYCQVKADPLVGPDSLRLGGSPDSDATSFS